jgi:uncharacterized membrane protein HdeD (DUF308 family)
MNALSDTISSSIKNWWWFVIKGLLLIIAGAAIFTRPAQGYLGLSVLFSIAILSAGLTQIFFSISNSDSFRGWGWTFASGIAFKFKSIKQDVKGFESKLKQAARLQ